MNYLEITQEVLDRPDARELVRFWISDGEDYLTLQGELWGEKEPEVWACVAADLMRQAIIKLCLKDSSRDPSALLADIKQHFDRRVAEINEAYTGRLEL